MKEVTLEPTESIVAILRPDPIAFRLSAVLGFLVFLSAWCFVFPLFRLGVTGVVIFSAMLAGSALWMYRAHLMRAHTLFMFTDQRYIHIEQYGLFGRHARAISYPKTWTVEIISGGYLSSLLGLSTIVIKSQKKRFRMVWMRGAAKLADFINEVQCLGKDHDKGKKTHR